MADLSTIYLYRMTHIANAPHILLHGITHRTSANKNPKFTPIGDPNLITSRNNFVLYNGRKLGVYIPFYFGVRTPMLFKIQKGLDSLVATEPEKIIYCVTSVQQIINMGLEFIFTDGHAIDSLSTQYSSNEIDRVEDILDFNAINAKYWKDENDLDMKRRKQAEFLLLGDLAFAAVLSFIVYNESTKNQLIQFGTEKDIAIRPEVYFKP